MDKIDFGPRYRTTRWYEWVVLLLLMVLVAGVRAESVYKCTDAQGGIAFQALPCSPQQNEAAVSIAPAPAHAVSPQYSTVKEPAEAHRTPHIQAVASRGHDISYECRVSDGQVFYRHTPCPHSLSSDNSVHKGKAHARGGQGLTVSSRVVSRAEACMQIHRPGAIGRAGREHDEDVSTYERDLGNDPCK
jgi:hypothetical protein